MVTSEHKHSTKILLNICFSNTPSLTPEASEKGKHSAQLANDE